MTNSLLMPTVANWVDALGVLISLTVYLCRPAAHHGSPLGVHPLTGRIARSMRHSFHGGHMPASSSPFHIPFPGRCAAQEKVDKARIGNLSWVKKHGLVRSDEGAAAFHATDYVDICARMFPDATEEGLVWASRFYSYGYLMDDQFPMSQGGRDEISTAVLHEQIHIMYRPLSAPLTYECPVTWAFRDLWGAHVSRMSRTWCDRFAAHYARFLAANVHEIRTRATHRDSRSFIATRRDSGGMIPLLHHNEWATEVEMPPQFMAQDLVHEMEVLTADTVGLMNDVQSLERELLRGDTYNMILLLEAERGWTRKKARQHVIDLTHRGLDALLSCDRRLPELSASLRLDEQETRAVERWSDCWRDKVTGYHDWATRGPRYTQPERFAWSTDDLLRANART